MLGRLRPQPRFYGDVTVEIRCMEELSFDGYRLLKLAECVVGPAVLNAVFAVRGKPIRNLSLTNEGHTFA